MTTSALAHPDGSLLFRLLTQWRALTVHGWHARSAWPTKAIMDIIRDCTELPTDLSSHMTGERRKELESAMITRFPNGKGPPQSIFHEQNDCLDKSRSRCQITKTEANQAPSRNLCNPSNHNRNPPSH
eukprot:GHVO01004386.1.p1 GENE.GHVO01004386.1~~GHVO01004386.1.p1  ORF type:complete len:128 (+),score=10.46 GHVO01004386.1:112-495(+)